MTIKNLPNEAGSWDEDFRYTYLERLYGVLRSKFILSHLGQAETACGAASLERPWAFVRHDLDMSLKCAVELARRESSWGVPSTYHVMLDSPFYDVRSSKSREMLSEIASLGHEIGLHYDVVARRTKDATSIERESDIGAACDELSSVLGAEVRSVSFHLPVPELVRGPFRIADRVSAYAAELFGWYLSDSRARWREGAPIEAVRQVRGPILQILIHPIWWGEDNLRPEVRLRNVLLEMVSSSQSFEELRTRAWAHIIYRAADVPIG